MPKKIVAIFILMFLFISFVEPKKKTTYSERKNQQKSHEQPHFLTPDKSEFWINALLATFLSLAGGFCSGMTVGLNSLSTLNLQIMSKSGGERDKRIAKRILDVIHDHHLFLVTLLVGNAIVLQSLPLVIHLIMPDWAAILFSTFIVLIVAEVVPMSLSTGPNKYIIAYYGAPLVALMIKLFWPICYPIARGLDTLLGTDHEQRISRRDFLTFINNKKKNFLETLEIQFINHVMNYKNRIIKQVMVPQQKSFTLQQKQLIDDNVLKQISLKQFSFIPVYRKEVSNIVGYVTAKEIILNYLSNKAAEVLPLNQLVKGKIVYKSVKIYCDAIAIEALGVLEETKTQVLLVSQKNKHTNLSQSTLSVFSSNEWIVPQIESNCIGFITLHQLLRQIAAYPTSTLKKVHRKLSRPQDQNDQEENELKEA